VEIYKKYKLYNKLIMDLFLLYNLLVQQFKKNKNQIPIYFLDSSNNIKLNFYYSLFKLISYKSLNILDIGGYPFNQYKLYFSDNKNSDITLTSINNIMLEEQIETQNDIPIYSKYYIEGDILKNKEEIIDILTKRNLKYDIIIISCNSYTYDIEIYNIIKYYCNKKHLLILSNLATINKWNTLKGIYFIKYFDNNIYKYFAINNKEFNDIILLMDHTKEYKLYSLTKNIIYEILSIHNIENNIIPKININLLFYCEKCIKYIHNRDDNFICNKCKKGYLLTYYN